MILLDTQSLLWLRLGNTKLGVQARRIAVHAWEAGDAAVSAITFWEIAMLRAKGRIDFPRDVAEWRQGLISDSLHEIPLDGTIGIRAALLESFHGDPADRVIVATALGVHRLLTSDRSILNWRGELQCIPARQ